MFRIKPFFNHMTITWFNISKKIHRQIDTVKVFVREEK